MTTPPPPHGTQGPWPGQQPPPGQPPTPPPGYPMPGQQYGPPPGQYPGWPPAGPPKKSNGLKWALAGVALIAVIAVAVTITVVVLRSDSGNGGKDGSSSTSDIASANDTGPVSIITDDPTCDKFMPINNGLANQSHNGWDQRDASVPATTWTSEERAQYQAVGNAFRNAAGQIAPLAKQTPHRVVRELYEQFMAYAEAYAESIPTYTAPDDYLALTANNALAAVKSICQALAQGSAGVWADSIPLAPSPSRTATPADLTKPQRLFNQRNPICDELIALADRYNADLSDWSQTDASIPATAWTPEQKTLNDDAMPVMSTFADNIERLGVASNNPVAADFATLSAQYLRAYVKANATYVSSDAYLNAAANNTGAVVMASCQAVGS